MTTQTTKDHFITVLVVAIICILFLMIEQSLTAVSCKNISQQGSRQHSCTIRIWRSRGALKLMMLGVMPQPTKDSRWYGCGNKIEFDMEVETRFPAYKANNWPYNLNEGWHITLQAIKLIICSWLSLIQDITRSKVKFGSGIKAAMFHHELVSTADALDFGIAAKRLDAICQFCSHALMVAL